MLVALQNKEHIGTKICITHPRTCASVLCSVRQKNYSVHLIAFILGAEIMCAIFAYTLMRNILNEPVVIGLRVYERI